MKTSASDVFAHRDCGTGLVRVLHFGVNLTPSSCVPSLSLPLLVPRPRVSAQGLAEIKATQSSKAAGLMVPPAGTVKDRLRVPCPIFHVEVWFCDVLGQLLVFPSLRQSQLSVLDLPNLSSLEAALYWDPPLENAKTAPTIQQPPRRTWMLALSRSTHPCTSSQ